MTAVTHEERFRLSSLAWRADRAMRTLAARTVAANVYRDLTATMLKIRAADDASRPLLAGLAARPGWSRQSLRGYEYRFGGRRSTITIPPQFDLKTLAALVTRAEIAALMSECDWPVSSELQSMAARQIQHLFSQHRAGRMYAAQ